MKIFHLFLLSTFVLCVGCSKVAFHPDGGWRPKNPNFRFAKNPFKLKDNSLIDTTTIYLEMKIDPHTYQIYYDSTSYVFYRFFNNGRLHIFTVPDSLPSIDDQNNVNRGLIGYYQIKKNEIIIEYFAPIDFGNYYYLYGVIKGDTIFFTHENRIFQGRKKRIDERIYKIKAPGKIFLYSRPDW